VRDFVLLPEALVVVGAVSVMLAGRFGWLPRGWRSFLPQAMSFLVLVALVVELWTGAALTSFFGGAVVQDRFALFAKAAVLLTTAVVLAATDWSAEDSLHLGLAMPMLAAFAVMVAASSANLLALWAGLELAAACGVVIVSLRRPDLGLRLLLAGGVASALILVGLAFLYATTGNADLAAIRVVLTGRSAALPLAIPLLLLVAGLALRAGVAPFHVANLPVGLAASPLGAGLVLGLVAVAAGVVAVKLAAALTPIPATYALYASVVAALAILGSGAAALAVRSPRPRLAYLAVGQLGWVAAGLATHYRSGLAASLFLLGAFAVAATCGPAMLGRAEGGEPAIVGFGALRPVRAAGLSLAMLSLAGAPPLGGFFGELSVAAALAQSGNFVVLGLALVGSVMGVVAALGTLRAVYLLTPLEESRRGGPAALPAVTAFSTAGVVAFCIVIAVYGLFSYPIFGLADQGAEALGLR